MEWINDLSKNALETMEELGNFGPTVHAKYREVKGYKMDANDGECGKCYYNSTDLRNIAAGCIEVADWLDKRAALAEQESQP